MRKSVSATRASYIHIALKLTPNFFLFILYCIFPSLIVFHWDYSSVSVIFYFFSLCCLWCYSPINKTKCAYNCLYRSKIILYVDTFLFYSLHFCIPILRVRRVESSKKKKKRRTKWVRCVCYKQFNLVVLLLQYLCI